ncbi:hypothetical protein HJC23_009190 [Cyclotella cryptica]|uniref:ABC transporter domain-containing protein n=1 Tax=Cyclotella cryptica TaxID=29204 RepID=A0ABD3PL83_9STRA
MMNLILDILDGNIPALDSEVKDYIRSLIEAALEDGDGESLSETVKEFLSEETSQQIIDELQTLTVMNDPMSSASAPSLGLLSHQSPPSLPELLPTTLDKFGDEFNSSPLPTKPSHRTATKSKLKQRKESRLAKKKGKSVNHAQTLTLTENNHGLVNDDHATPQEECKASNKLWGGRGQGRNGVGKSTLLKQIESGSIPGLPRGLVLLEEQDKLEKEMDDGVNMEHNAQRLSELAVELDAIDSDNTEQRALDILKGLSFSDDMIHSTTAKLSGGWRMCLALAQALFVPYSDLLLLDKVTNHLNLNGMSWLERYLTDESRQDSLTLICVSHVRSFLDDVCTDVIVMEHKRLTYHSGNYSDYQQKMSEKNVRESQIPDAAERQRSKAEAFVQKQQQSKKSSDPNKQRQAKMIEELNSLKKLSEDYVQLAQKVQVEVDDPVYAEGQFASGSASSEVILKASGNVQQYLGAFGLGGSHAHRLIVKLSGGERMRLCFATTALADSPHILLLDESTNHVDLETLDSLAEALRVYKGAILMVSHNQAFLGNFCNELWAIDDKTGTVSTSKNVTESFDQLFSQYRSRVLTSGGRGALNRQCESQVKAGMVKQAAKQAATAKTNTALL